jgi:small subunit ribosomal protein S14
MSQKEYGKGIRTCKMCGTNQAIIRRYGINICRRCFRENAKKLGFKKYN